MRTPLHLLVVVATAACGPSSVGGDGDGDGSGSEVGTASVGTAGEGTASEGTASADDGPFPPTCAPPLPGGVCDEPAAMVCGNGMLDSCEICFSSDDGPVTCETVTEACEGTDLGGSTCASLGFRAGELSCGDACRLDARDCDACADRPDLTCARPRVDAVEAFRFVLAHNGDVLAAAWDTLDDVVHVATWDASLELVAEQPCAPALVGTASIGLGPAPGGFLLGLGTGGDNPVIELRRLDLTGVDLGSPRMIDTASFPVFVGRPGAAPLLAYASTDFAGASETPTTIELLDDAGQAVSQAMLADPAMPDSLSGAFVDDVFLLARAPTPATADGTWIVPIDVAGNPGTATFHDAVRQLVLAPADGGQAAAVWLSGETFYAGRVDTTGALVGTPVQIGVRDQLVAEQAHVVASTGALDVAGVVEGMRADLRATHLAGGASVDAYVLASEPGELGPIVATAFGGDVVVAWTAGWD